MRFKAKRPLFVHRGTTVERLPSGKIDVRDDWGLPEDIPARPQEMACDCCLAMTDRHWYWPHRGFCLRCSDHSRITIGAGEWCVCVFCRPLFEQMDLQALVARVVTLNPQIVTADLAALYRAVFLARFGEPQYWEAGQAYLKRPDYSDEEMTAILLRS